jgi:hypothetical protein
MESSASAGRVASAVLDPRRADRGLPVRLPGLRRAGRDRLALAFLLPGRPRKPAHELPEPDPVADAAATGDVVIRSGTK